MKTKSIIFFIMAVIASNFVHSVETADQGTQTETEAYQSFNRYHFSIAEKEYSHGTFFEIDSEDTYRGNVKKSKFLRHYYDLSDINGECATGIKRFFSLGSFFAWAAEIDIYDANDKWLGKIEGKVLTTAKARFHLYDKYEDLVGIAVIDDTGKGITITKPGNETYTLARLERKIIEGGEDHWKVIVYEPATLEDRLIRVFAGFCLDVQDRFYQGQ